MKRSIPFNYHQDLTIDDEHHHRSSTLYTPPLNPYYYSPPPPPQLIPQHVNQLCQHPQQQLLQPPPQQVLLERTHYFAAAGYNGNRYCETLPIPYNNNNYVGVGVPNSHDQPQQQGSTARVSFWKAFNTEVSDAKGGKEEEEEVKEKKRCLVYDSAVENSVLLQSQTTVATAGLSLGEFHVSNVSAPATATLVGVDQLLFSSEKKQDSKKKKRIKRKVKEELVLMNAFFKKMVKGVINQQEVLHNKFVEVIERMDREQAEREEAWRREESEIYEREAAAKEHDRVLASRRESSIISSIEKITGKRLGGGGGGPMKIDDDIN